MLDINRKKVYLIFLLTGILLGYFIHLGSSFLFKKAEDRATGILSEKIEVNVFDLSNSFQHETESIKWKELAVNGSAGVVLVSIKDRMPTHIHKSEDHYTYVISGNGEYVQDGKIIVLEPGKFILTPRNTAHEIINKGIEPLLFLVFSSPIPFQEKNIEWVKN